MFVLIALFPPQALLLVNYANINYSITENTALSDLWQWGETTATDGLLYLYDHQQVDDWVNNYVKHYAQLYKF